MSFTVLSKLIIALAASINEHVLCKIDFAKLKVRPIKPYLQLLIKKLAVAIFTKNNLLPLPKDGGYVFASICLSVNCREFP